MKPLHVPTKTVDPKSKKAWSPRLGAVALPVEHGKGTVSTYWSFSFWERIQVLLGRPVVVCIVSKVQPPLALEVAKE